MKLRRLKSVLLGLALALSVFPSMAGAQDEPRRRLIRLDAEAFYLTGSLVGQFSDLWYWGGEGGAGVGILWTPQTNDNINGRWVHFGALLTRAGSRTDLDLGAQLGFGFGSWDRLDSWEDSWEDFPDTKTYGGLVTSFAVGWDRVRFGTRVFLGKLPGEVTLASSPLFLRIRF